MTENYKTFMTNKIIFFLPLKIKHQDRGKAFEYRHRKVWVHISDMLHSVPINSLNLKIVQ